MNMKLITAMLVSLMVMLGLIGYELSREHAPMRTNSPRVFYTPSPRPAPPSTATLGFITPPPRPTPLPTQDISTLQTMLAGTLYVDPARDTMTPIYEGD